MFVSWSQTPSIPHWDQTLARSRFSILPRLFSTCAYTMWVNSRVCLITRVYSTCTGTYIAMPFELNVYACSMIANKTFHLQCSVRNHRLWNMHRTHQFRRKSHVKGCHKSSCIYIVQYLPNTCTCTCTLLAYCYLICRASLITYMVAENHLWMVSSELLTSCWLERYS